MQSKVDLYAEVYAARRIASKGSLTVSSESPIEDPAAVLPGVISHSIPNSPVSLPSIEVSTKQVEMFNTRVKFVRFDVNLEVM